MGMNMETDKNRSRNVTPKDLIQAAFAVVVVVILGWYKETGSKTAAFVFAAIPVAFVLYYLRVPAEQRRRAAQQAKAEMKNSTIGRLWKGFFYLWVVIALVLLIHSFVVR